MKKCAICGAQLGEDLFSAVTGEPVCSICKLKYIGGLPTSRARIDKAREILGLSAGQYLNQNNAEEASKILKHGDSK
jgi:recombinational DNA repair protein (RecF pathway)